MSGLVIIAANLKPRKLGGFLSNGMVLMASSSDHSIIELLRPQEGFEQTYFNFYVKRYTFGRESNYRRIWDIGRKERERNKPQTKYPGKMFRINENGC